MTTSFERSVLVTGGTIGLGYSCAMNIACQHPEYQVVLASRTNSQDSATTINKMLNQNNVSYRKLDLSSLDDIRAFARRWQEEHYAPIEILVLNAGLQLPGEIQYTDDGFESTFAINHMGHALLFFLLQPHLSDTARIVSTASGTHDPKQKTGLPDAKYTTAEELGHPTSATITNPGRQRYATSKLANVMWTYALHRRFTEMSEAGKKSWTAVAFDPGLMPGTGLARETGYFLRFIWLHILPNIMPLLRMLVSPNIHSAEDSGASLAWLAISPEVKSTSGTYYEGKKKIPSSEESYDVAKQEDLWDWTIKNVASSKEEAASFQL
ncbi:hypothetical protein NQZ79_g6321 [Umbelopsis isabellina]|nr:hypothetical protein NQZ79_g6321 [Umbelopsis isabellina]